MRILATLTFHADSAGPVGPGNSGVGLLAQLKAADRGCSSAARTEEEEDRGWRRRTWDGGGAGSREKAERQIAALLAGFSF